MEADPADELVGVADEPERAEPDSRPGVRAPREPASASATVASRITPTRETTAGARDPSSPARARSERDELGQLVEPVAGRVPVVGLADREVDRPACSRRPTSSGTSGVRSRTASSVRSRRASRSGCGGKGSSNASCSEASQPAPSPRVSRGPATSRSVSTERARTRGSRKVAERTSEPSPIRSVATASAVERRPALEHRRASRRAPTGGGRSPRRRRSPPPRPAGRPRAARRRACRRAAAGCRTAWATVRAGLVEPTGC